jgi:hypothetical protein
MARSLLLLPIEKEQSMKTRSLFVLVPVVILAAACGGGTAGVDLATSSLEASSSIGPSGGLILLADGTGISIPKGALRHTVTITVEENPSAPAVDGVAATGATYLFGPEGTTFDKPVTLTLAIDPSRVPADATSEDISVFTAPRGSADYVSLPTSLVNSRHVTATTTHFSNFSSGVSHLGSINPDNPMTDADMSGGQSITVAKMQSFLASEKSALADYVDPGSHKSAAEIIVNQSQSHGLSPVYMLARLQSEEGLVEDSRDYDKSELDVRLNSATGCGCPSTCDKSLSGFREQIECAATNTATYMHDADHGGSTVSGWRVGHEKTTADHCTVRPANAATAALYTYTPYEGYEDSNRYCAGAKALTAAGEDGLEVTGLAMLFYKYAKAFPGSTSKTSTEPPCSGETLGQKIANLAAKNNGKSACEKNSKDQRGFSTVGAWGNSCTGNGCDGRDVPEYWCADFATWVWAQSGVHHTSELGSGAESFADYGKKYHTSKSHKPALGDAVVFDSGSHVAIVTQVNKDGTIETESGDWGGSDDGAGTCSSEAQFSSSSHVVHNTPAYLGKVGTYSNTMDMTITAIVSPVGGAADTCKGSGGDPGGVTPPKNPPVPSVCCATCSGQSSSYYAAQVKNASGTLESCEDAAKDFCQFNFGAGVSEAEKGSCPLYSTGTGGTPAPGGGSGGSSGSGGDEASCKLDGADYDKNTCTETKQCNGSSWVARSSDPAGCLSGVKASGACLTDTGSVVPHNTCDDKLQCDDGVWIDRADDPSLCDCKLGGKIYSSNTCTETLQCDDGNWIARASDPSGCDHGFATGGGCLSDKGDLVAKNTCTATLQCNDGVWVPRSGDSASCL